MIWLSAFLGTHLSECLALKLCLNEELKWRVLQTKRPVKSFQSAQIPEAWCHVPPLMLQLCHPKVAERINVFQWRDSWYMLTLFWYNAKGTNITNPKDNGQPLTKRKCHSSSQRAGHKESSNQYGLFLEYLPLIRLISPESLISYWSATQTISFTEWPGWYTLTHICKQVVHTHTHTHRPYCRVRSISTDAETSLLFSHFAPFLYR